MNKFLKFLKYICKSVAHVPPEWSAPHKGQAFHIVLTQLGLQRERERESERQRENPIYVHCTVHIHYCTLYNALYCTVMGIRVR